MEAAIYNIGFVNIGTVYLLNYFMQTAFMCKSLYHFIFVIPQFLMCNCLERRNGSLG